MKKIAEVLKELFRKHPQLERLKFFSLPSMWREAVGNLVAEKARVIDLKNGVLYISCKDPLWLSELHFRKTRIIEKLNELAGENIVRDIVFKTR